MFFSLLSLFMIIVTEDYAYIQSADEAPESLRALLDQRFSYRANGNSGPFHLQLEAKTYYSDGIVIENEDIIISGA